MCGEHQETLRSLPHCSEFWDRSVLGVHLIHMNVMQGSCHPPNFTWVEFWNIVNCIHHQTAEVVDKQSFREPVCCY